MNEYRNNVFVPSDAPDDYRKHVIENLIDKTILQFRDGFLSEGGMSLSIKVENHTHGYPPYCDGFFDGLGTVYSATAFASMVKVIHETNLQLDAIQHDYRYAKLSDVMKYKFSELIKKVRK
jgi:hypothetical protein